MSLGVAVVTGGTGLIGRACCQTLSAMGYRVIAVDRNAVGLREVSGASGSRIQAIECDITDDAQSKRLWASSEWSSQVEALVCCAGGVLVGQGPSEHIRTEDFERVIALNLTAAWRWAQLATPFMRQRGRGRIVTFSSDSVSLGFPGGMAPYVAAKGAIIGLTRTLARELGADGITVNSISPGLVPDKGGVKARAANSPFTQAGQEENRRQWHALQTVPGDIEPEDIAGAVGFLCSDAARKINGQVIHVNGGSYCGD